MGKDLRTFIADLRKKLPGNYIEVEKEINSKFERGFCFETEAAD